MRQRPGKVISQVPGVELFGAGSFLLISAVGCDSAV